MKVFVQAKPSAHEESIEKIESSFLPNGESRKESEPHFKVEVTEPPVKGMANRAIARVLADYFKVAPSRVRLVTGYASRQKVFEII